MQVNRLERWDRPGLLCIGDAAHAMSPAFGVGVNYAVQDAIATANLLAADLRRGLVVTERALARVQRRRELPVRLMQPIQLVLHRRVVRPGGPAGRVPETLPAPVRLLGRAVQPVVQRLTARLIGLGFRPERVRLPLAGMAPPVPPRGPAQRWRAAAQPLRQARPEQRLEVAEQRRRWR